MTRNVTEIQRRLIDLKYLPAVDPDTLRPSDDGKFGLKSLDAYNHLRAAQGKPPVHAVTMAMLNADLFPEEQPPAPAPKPSILSSILLSFALNNLKGSTMFAFLDGYKTKITGAVMVLVGVSSLACNLFALHVAGLDALSPGEAWTSVTGGFGLIFLRAAVAKNGAGN